MPGRNDPCPCGSGKKFKKCCGQNSRSTTLRQSFHMPAAIAAYRQGQLAEAIRICQIELSENPDNADALGLSGICHYMSGDLASAQYALEQQAARQPDNADAHNNLGLVLLERGDMEGAHRHGHRAAEIDPRSADAQNNLGNIYRAANRLQEAAEFYRAAIALNAKDARFHCSLGAVEQALARDEQAERSYRRALQLAPDFTAAHNNLAALLQERKAYDEAWIHYQRALRGAPEDAEILSNIGSYWKDRGDLDQADEFLARALQADPDYAGAHVNRGLVAEERADADAAQQHYERALELDPEHTRAHEALGALLLNRGYHDLAVHHFSQALRWDPNLAGANAGLARALLSAGNPKARGLAQKAYSLRPDDPYVCSVYADVLLTEQRPREVVSLWQDFQHRFPDSSTAHMRLAEAYASVAEFDKAAEQFESATQLAQDPRSILAQWAESEEKRHAIESADLLLRRAIGESQPDTKETTLLAVIEMRRHNPRGALKILVDAPVDPATTPLRQQLDYAFVLGAVNDQLGDYDAAFEAFARGNEIKNIVYGDTYDRQVIADHSAQLREYFQPSRRDAISRCPPSDGSGTATPIFIVGFPRSGTSLLEQILASHADVAAGGELVCISNLVQYQGAQVLGSPRAYPAWLHDITSNDQLIALRRHYLECVDAAPESADNAAFLTDKMPLNLPHVGLIQMLFPESPIIHVARHPLDACLSAFSSNFTQGNRYTSTIENTAYHYAAVMDLTDFYQTTLDMKFMQLRYEDLIDDQETSVRRILQWIGLPWDENCLRFYENKRVVKTASYAQVTRQIYSSSRFRYRHYLKQLRSVVPILEPSIKRFGYTVDE